MHKKVNDVKDNTSPETEVISEVSKIKMLNGILVLICIFYSFSSKYSVIILIMQKNSVIFLCTVHTTEL